jgi:hypothetical protein
MFILSMLALDTITPKGLSLHGKGVATLIAMDIVIALIIIGSLGV